MADAVVEHEEGQPEHPERVLGAQLSVSHEDVELFGEPGILQLEPDYETRTWLMEDIDTGLAIGGAKLPFETYFTYGTPSKLSVSPSPLTWPAARSKEKV